MPILSPSRRAVSKPAIYGFGSFWSCCLSWISATSILQRSKISASSYNLVANESQFDCGTELVVGRAWGYTGMCEGLIGGCSS